MSGPWIAVLIGIVLAAAFIAAYLVFTRKPKGSHSRPFADPGDTSDPDGSIWVRSIAGDPDQPVHRPRTLHHEMPFPVAGTLEMLPAPAPPAAAPGRADEDPFAAYPDTPQPEPDWSATEWTKAQARDMNRWLDENVRSVPVPGADDLDEMARRYAEVTR